MQRRPKAVDKAVEKRVENPWKSPGGKQKKPKRVRAWAYLAGFLGWLMGLEPTTTGITIRDSTN